ncbi:MAG: LON peptidase substrate-binding domain-containing protein [Lacipirellulaceae bacterium]
MNDPAWSSDDTTFDASSFSGVARLFPLPGVALYPRIVQPLHIFEDRYRALMEDALAGDRLITMAVLCPGWEGDYPGRPRLEPVACLGRIVAHHRMADGRFNLLLAGERRVRLVEELSPPQAFRRAAVEILDDIEPYGLTIDTTRLWRSLAEAFRRALPAGEPPEALQQVFSDETPLGLLADLAAYTLPLPTRVKVAALAEADVAVRAAALVAELSAGETPPFPPPFSLN